MILDPDHPGHILRQDHECISLRRISDGAPKINHSLVHDDINNGAGRPALFADIGENAIADRRIMLPTLIETPASTDNAGNPQNHGLRAHSATITP